MAGIAVGARGAVRLGLVRLHRLAEFARVFTMYLDGKAEADEVVMRFNKLLAVGLPQRINGSMAWALMKAVTVKWGLN